MGFSSKSERGKPGRMAEASRNSDARFRRRLQLTTEGCKTALEILNLERDVDGLLESIRGIAAENAGHTGRDRCYTAIRHARCLLWAQALGTPACFNRSTNGKSPGTGSDSPDDQGSFAEMTRHLRCADDRAAAARWDRRSP